MAHPTDATDTPAGSVTGGLEAIDSARTASEMAPVSSLVISPLTVADGAALTREIVALHLRLLDVGHVAEGHARSPTRQCREPLDRVDGRGVQAQQHVDRRGGVDRAGWSSPGPRSARRERSPPTCAAETPAAAARSASTSDLDLGRRRDEVARQVGQAGDVGDRVA